MSLLFLIALFSTVVSQSANCGDLVCDPFSESCCPDSQKGSICCIKEETFCCLRDGQTASHCCPRWTVCCPGGRFGCCSPDEGWGWDKIYQLAPRPSTETTALPTLPSTAYALFVKAELESSPVEGTKIDTATGHQTEIKIENGESLDWGEMTRIFGYSAKKNVFYLVQANFTATEKSKDDPAYPVNLFVVDPTSGKLTVIPVKGVTNQVTGFYHNDANDMIIMASYTFTSGNVTGYNFYSVDTNTGSSTFLSSSHFGVKDNFAGWFHSGTADGKTVYRLGNLDVVHENTPGIGITDISGSTATTTFDGNVPMADGVNGYITLSQLDDTSFVSMGPDSRSGKLAVVKWHLKGNATVVYRSDTYVPRMFGPVWQAVSSDKSSMVAITVEYGANPLGIHDHWRLLTVDLNAASGATHAFSPEISAATASLSGVGIPNQ